MSQSIEALRFRFEEDLALKNSLYPVADFVLKYAVKVSGASSGVFLYDSPGSKFLEKVAAVGLSAADEEKWAKCSKDSKEPLPEVIRTQQFKVIGSEQAPEFMAFPLKDFGLTCAGFSLSFSPAQKMNSEMRDFLIWISRKAESAIFVSDGEGV